MKLMNKDKKDKEKTLKKKKLQGSEKTKIRKMKSFIYNFHIKILYHIDQKIHFLVFFKN